MSDALVPVLDLWQKAFLVMDEVDVLLHPLRSELNFPIGHKVPIDLGSHRWNLPFFILDALVFLDQSSRRTSSSGDGSRSGPADLPCASELLLFKRSSKSSGAVAMAQDNDDEDDNEDLTGSPPPQPLVRRRPRAGEEVLGELKEAPADGIGATRCGEPHLVLLDTAWYAVPRPIVARWVVLWLPRKCPP